MTMEDRRARFGRHNGEVGNPIMDGETYMHALVNRAVSVANMAMYTVRMDDDKKSKVRTLLRETEGSLEIPVTLVNAFLNENLLYQVQDAQRYAEIEQADILYDLALPPESGRTRDPIDRITIHSVVTPRSQGISQRTKWYLSRISRPQGEEAGPR